MVVTTGTADADDDDAFADDVRQASGDNVQISVVHVGGGEPDAALASVAAAAVDAAQADDIAGAVNRAAGL